MVTKHWNGAVHFIYLLTEIDRYQKFIRNFCYNYIFVHPLRIEHFMAHEIHWWFVCLGLCLFACALCLCICVPISVSSAKCIYSRLMNNWHKQPNLLYAEKYSHSLTQKTNKSKTSNVTLNRNRSNGSDIIYHFHHLTNVEICHFSIRFIRNRTKSTAYFEIHTNEILLVECNVFQRAKMHQMISFSF